MRDTQTGNVVITSQYQMHLMTDVLSTLMTPHSRSCQHKQPRHTKYKTGITKEINFN